VLSDFKYLVICDVFTLWFTSDRIAYNPYGQLIVRFKGKMIFTCTISVRGGPSVWVDQTMDPKKKLKRGRPEIGVREISLQITDAHLTQLDAKAAEADVTRSVWLRTLFDKIF